MLRVFILCAERLQTPDDDISDAYCSVTYEGMDGLFRGPEGGKKQLRSYYLKVTSDYLSWGGAEKEELTGKRDRPRGRGREGR